MTFDPSDPKWPQIDIWPHDIGRGFQDDDIYESYGHAMYHGRVRPIVFFCENDLLTPVTPNDPRLTFDPIT